LASSGSSPQSSRIFALQRRFHPHSGKIVRFNIGLERAEDLIADLQRGFAVLRGQAAESGNP